MEQIIVTFIHNGIETDVTIPNKVEGQNLVAAINEWLDNKDDWSTSLHDLEYSFDNKNWFCLQKNKTLHDAGIWDGAYLRLSDDIASTLPTESQFEMNSHDEHDAEYDSDEAPGYAWKIIE